MYNIVKRYYDKDIYSNEDVAKFVLAGKINATEYEQITGEKYGIEEKVVEDTTEESEVA